MRVFVYEHLAALPAGGLPLLEAEARAMHEAVVADLARIPNFSVVTLLHSQRDRDFPASVSVIRCESSVVTNIEEIAKHADAALVIAPETDGILAEIVEAVERVGCRLLGPDSQMIRLFTDKLRTADHLGPLSVPTSDQPLVNAPAQRIVVKPRDGVGSECVVTCRPEELEQAVAKIRARGNEGPLVYQPYLAGTAASIAMIGRRNGQVIYLPAVLQHIHVSADAAGSALQWLEYSGGETPIEEATSARAQFLARSFVERTAHWQGYLGLDLLLGHATNGSEDVVIEVNPRLTTSYVGYRQILGEILPFVLVDHLPADLEAWRLPFREERITGNDEVCAVRASSISQRDILLSCSVKRVLQFTPAGVIHWNSPRI